jgi:hypothetical protein
MEKRIKDVWNRFHKFMKSGRLNKVCKKCLN